MCGTGVFPAGCLTGIRHRGSPGRKKCQFWGHFGDCHAAGMDSGEKSKCAARFDFLIPDGKPPSNVDERSAPTLEAAAD
ncbi:hypothetical protein DWW96_07925 [Eubacterium sp. AF17-7]|nr:hypothetical protein DWW96_07925 [Eubacterium sp. AF17-7]